MDGVVDGMNILQEKYTVHITNQKIKEEMDNMVKQRIKKWTTHMGVKERQRNFISDLIEQYGLEDYICIILDDKLSETPEGIKKMMNALCNHGLMMICGNEITYHKSDYPDEYYIEEGGLK